MKDEAQSRDSATSTKRRGVRTRLQILLALIALIAIFLLVPPWISIGRYQSRIAEILSQSVGRPVQISSVELRLLPVPGFLINNLSIAEDPAYGAEPVLHANTVRANIRLLSLWRGKIEIGAIDVDEASLNIVRAGQGRWNLDPLFRIAAARAGAPSNSGAAFRWPSLQATNSRINIKNGAEKLPFSLVNTDLSFWQESGDEWRIRLRGQPARTDVALELGDTGIMRIEASMKHAQELSQMPLLLDLDWRQAQLGQLSKLLVGTDPGWRGDLTGNLHLEGTPASAQVITRLRATGVHRAEFSPPTPLDFDANCHFLFRYSQRAVENLNCDSPLGNGRAHLTGAKPGGNEPANLTLELDQIPVGAGLDILRTMRSGLAPDLEAEGLVSGRVEYAPQNQRLHTALKRASKAGEQEKSNPRGPLSGSITIDGFQLRGGALSQPIRSTKITLQAVGVPEGASAASSALEGTATLNAGGSNPLNVTARLSSSGYEASFRGTASIPRARELALVAGWAQANALVNLAGDPVTVNLTAEGPWLAQEPVSSASPVAAAQAHAIAAASAALGVPRAWPSVDTITGTIAVRDANWKADYLANHVQIAQATLTFDTNAMRWDPVDFSYGPVKGSATVTIPMMCADDAGGPQSTCVPQFHIRFGQLDTKVLEAALLGAREKGTMLSSLIDRLHPAAAPVWPKLNGTVSAESMTLGQVKIERAAATVMIDSDHADFSDMEGSLLGGQMQGSGTVSWAGNDRKQPTYSVTARCDRVNAAAVGALLGQSWSGGPLTVDGKVDLAGFTGAELADSAKGALHFEWRRGATAGGTASRFDTWSGDAQIQDGAVKLGENEVLASGRKQSLEGVVPFASPAKVRFTPAKSK